MAQVRKDVTLVKAELDLVIRVLREEVDSDDRGWADPLRDIANALEDATLIWVENPHG